MIISLDKQNPETDIIEQVKTVNECIVDYCEIVDTIAAQIDVLKRLRVAGNNVETLHECMMNNKLDDNIKKFMDIESVTVENLVDKKKKIVSNAIDTLHEIEAQTVKYFNAWNNSIPELIRMLNECKTNIVDITKPFTCDSFTGLSLNDKAAIRSYHNNVDSIFNIKPEVSVIQLRSREESRIYCDFMIELLLNISKNMDKRIDKIKSLSNIKEKPEDIYGVYININNVSTFYEDIVKTSKDLVRNAIDFIVSNRFG